MERFNPKEKPNQKKEKIKKFLDNIFGPIYDFYLNLKYRERRNIEEAQEIANTVNYFLRNVEIDLNLVRERLNERKDMPEERKNSFNENINKIFYSKKNEFITILSDIIRKIYYIAIEYESKVLEVINSQEEIKTKQSKIWRLSLKYVEEIEKIINNKDYYDKLKIFLFLLFDLRKVIKEYLNIDININQNIKQRFKSLFISPVVSILERSEFRSLLTPSEEELFSHLSEDDLFGEEISEEEQKRELNLDFLRLSSNLERPLYNMINNYIIEDIISKLESKIDKIYDKIWYEYINRLAPF